MTHGYVHIRNRLQCPDLLIPINGSAVGAETSTTLLWAVIAAASSYDVYVWLDGDDRPSVPTANVTDPTYIATGLSLATTYRWVVLAVDAFGKRSAGCSESTFTTDVADATIEWQAVAFSGNILGPSVTLTAIRTGNTTTAVSADYDFTEGSALIGPDFIATPGTVAFAHGEVAKDVIVPLVRDYDAEFIAATSPKLYCRMDSPSPTTSFPDISGNSHDLLLAGSTSDVGYQQQDLLLDPGGSFWRDNRGTNFSLHAAMGTPTSNPTEVGEEIPYTFFGWEFISNAALTQNKTLCMIGGPDGGGQFKRGWFFRDGAGNLSVRWFGKDAFGSGTGGHTLTFSTVLPINEAFWFTAGLDTANKVFTFKLNDGAVESISYAAVSPYMLQRPNDQVNVCFMERMFSNGGEPLDGYGARFAWKVGVQPDLDMWTRWNLGAQLTFQSTLSNPSINAQIGAIADTTMTIAAP